MRRAFRTFNAILGGQALYYELSAKVFSISMVCSLAARIAAQYTAHARREDPALTKLSRYYPKLRFH